MPGNDTGHMLVSKPEDLLSGFATNTCEVPLSCSDKGGSFFY